MQLVRRKWGYYVTLLDRKRFKVKLLRFRAGSECSMQYHAQRNEVWLFLSGMGEFRGLKTRRMVKSCDYAAVRQGAWHQYQAKKKTWVLEIQYGLKCDEEDIVRA